MDNANNAKRGRPSKWYTGPDGTEYKGLMRQTDGRWKIKATGFRFAEAEPALAVARFLKLTASERHVTISRTVTPIADIPEIAHLADDLAKMGYDKVSRSVTVGSDAFWSYVRETFLKNPAYVAERTGLPQLANWINNPLPGKSPMFASLLSAYDEHATVSKPTKRNARRAVNEFIKLSGCVTLRDATADVVMAYREASRKLHSPDTALARWRRLRRVVDFGLGENFNAAEIRGFLDRSAVLKPKTKRKRAAPAPAPIEPVVFRKLLAGADVEMRAFLILSLNAAMYVSEALAVEWQHLNLETGVLVTSRNKTGVLRAATLWPETVDAIKALKRKAQSPFLFTSSHGTKYNVNSFGKRFARLRSAVGVAASVEHNNMRDGAYSAAAASPGVPFLATQIMAGHTLPGVSDHYVARNPELVRPACDAVYAAYSPLPKSAKAVRIGRPKKG